MVLNLRDSGLNIDTAIQADLADNLESALQDYVETACIPGDR